MVHVLTLAVYGAATMALAVVVRPALEGWMGWLVELFAVLFCTAIVASVFNASGPRKECAEPRKAATRGRVSTSMDAGWGPTRNAASPTGPPPWSQPGLISPSCICCGTNGSIEPSSIWPELRFHP